MSKNKGKKPDPEEIKISDRANVKPAIETKPDQEVLNKPIPKLGQGLAESWGHPRNKKK